MFDGGLPELVTTSCGPMVAAHVTSSRSNATAPSTPTTAVTDARTALAPSGASGSDMRRTYSAPPPLRVTKGSRLQDRVERLGAVHELQPRDSGVRLRERQLMGQVADVVRRRQR